jgi:hypothetical protein
MRALLCLALLCACGPAPGRLTLSASGGDAVEHGFTTADGYAVSFTKVALSVGEFALATSAGQSGPTTNGTLTVDLLEPAPRLLRVFENVPAQRWDAVRWSVGNDGGVSLQLEGTLSKDNTNKTFAWSFSTNTLYSKSTEGVTIPSNGKATAELDVDLTRLWSDSLSDAGTLRGDALFNADTGDSVITLEELTATATPPSYEQFTFTNDLGDFVKFQTRGFGRFNGAPCTITQR